VSREELQRAVLFPERLRHEMERVVHKPPYGVGDDDGDEAAE